MKDLLSQRDKTALNWHKNNPEYVIEGEDVTRLRFFFYQHRSNYTIAYALLSKTRENVHTFLDMGLRTHKINSLGLWKAKQIQGPGDINWNNVTLKS